MIALLALANKTSDSVIAPEVARTILILILSVESFSKDALTASAEPVESALTIMLKLMTSPVFASKSSNLAPPDFAFSASSFASLRFIAISLASASVGKAMKRSPANGVSLKPITLTGVLGVATLTTALYSLVILRALPYEVPTTK